MNLIGRIALYIFGAYFLVHAFTAITKTIWVHQDIPSAAGTITGGFIAFLLAVLCLWIADRLRSSAKMTT
jgi:hypothetical protein